MKSDWGQRLKVWIIRFVFATLLVGVAFGQESGRSSVLFPVPENIMPNVAFWKKVYTLYSSNQVMIHDMNDLRIIYEVVTFDVPMSEYSPARLPWRDVEQVKEKYRAILRRLAQFDRIVPESLAPEERAVYQLFGEKATPSTFLKAAESVRAQQGLRDEFRRGLIRSGRYVDHILKVLDQYNIPRELVALPHVESSYNYRAYSKFGAAGIWQFTRGTGRRFLTIDYLVDERFDPIKSTEAAAKLLLENYLELGTWPLTINAYNHGVNGLKRAVAQLGTTDIGVIIEKYESRSYQFASRNFYAEFIAALDAHNNYRVYFGELAFDQPENFIAFKLPDNIRLSLLADRLGFDMKEIERLNPSLRSTVLTSKRPLPKGFELRLPWRENFDPMLAFAKIPAAEKRPEPVATDWYQVESGDNLQSIARRFKTTVSELMELNDINNPHQIYVGQVIRIRQEPVELAQTTESAPLASKPEIQPQPSVSAPASPSGASQPPARTLPSEARTDQQRLETTKTPEVRPVPSTPSVSVTPSVEASAQRQTKPSFGKIIVQHEETLGHYADWLRVPTQVIRNLNNLRPNQDIQLGQEIKVVFSNVTEKEFQRKRMEYHRGIEEDFFASYTIEGVLVHKIKSGENIWYLCNQVYEIPYWLLQKYNPNRNLERLSAGDELIIPIIGQPNNNRNAG